jgi:hypothetical protein
MRLMAQLLHVALVQQVAEWLGLVEFTSMTHSVIANGWSERRKMLGSDRSRTGSLVTAYPQYWKCSAFSVLPQSLEMFE